MLQVNASSPGEHYIEAVKSLVDKPLRSLKCADMFAVFDMQGDMNAAIPGADGLYFEDMRFQSRLLFRLGGALPLLLGSVVLDDNAALAVDLTNTDLHDGEPDDALSVPRDSIFINRLKVLHAHSCFERILLRRYERVDRILAAQIAFEADFADLSEVRGERRAARGSVTSEVIDERTVRFVYSGLDGIERASTTWFDPVPDRLSAGSAEWDVDLREGKQFSITTKTRCSAGETDVAEPTGHREAFRAYRQGKAGMARMLRGIETSDALADQVFSRGASDIGMLLTETEFGPYPYAGLPWYSTVFGRDGILTAMQLLWIAPQIARGVLRVLARTQARNFNEAADAEPGKIVHEMRSGEMARLGEVPFRRYYGTIDATPLFLWLAGEYLIRTGDLATIREIRPNIDAAIAWIDEYGDRDGDGFVEYERRTDRGLANQGWKDSHDSISHSDGSLAEGPIALCEVQGYAYAAKRAGARIAAAFGDDARADRLDRSAESLRQAFEEAFWLDDLGTYALALDGRKKPCRVRASNAGHALATGIAAPDRAGAVADLLMGNGFYSGWGIRTLSAGEARYNPMSYHNGSVWPHDNAIIALGLARYGRNAQAARLLAAMLDAAQHFEFRRLPELFCGFQRGRRRGPTPYPVACAPQAWAAAAPFALLQASIGLELYYEDGDICLSAPALPEGLNQLLLPKLHIDNSSMTLRLSRSGGDIVTTVLQRAGPAGLVVRK